MEEAFQVIGLVVGVLSIVAVTLLVGAGIALTCVKRDEDGDL